MVVMPLKCRRILIFPTVDVGLCREMLNMIGMFHLKALFSASVWFMLACLFKLICCGLCPIFIYFLIIIWSSNGQQDDKAWLEDKL
jgi:hypothetical protein